MWTAAQSEAVRRVRPLTKRKKGWKVSSNCFLVWLSECDVITALLNYSSTPQTKGKDIMEYTESRLLLLAIFSPA